MSSRGNAIAAGVALSLLASIASASAAVTVLATAAPEHIPVGGTVELSFQLNLSPDGPQYFGEKFIGGAFELFSGDGQHKTFFFGPGGTSRNFIWDVTYSTAGNYIPSFLGLVSYSEKFLDIDLRCGRHGCVPHVDIETAVRFQLLKGNFDDPGVGDSVVNVAAAPELSTWMMMLIGFAGLGFAAWRRRKPADAAA